jgi:hypothetical protein
MTSRMCCWVGKRNASRDRIGYWIATTNFLHKASDVRILHLPAPDFRQLHKREHLVQQGARGWIYSGWLCWSCGCLAVGWKAGLFFVFVSEHTQVQRYEAYGTRARAQRLHKRKHWLNKVWGAQLGLLWLWGVQGEREGSWLCWSCGGLAGWVGG